MKKTLFYWTLPLLIMIIIFLFSAQPSDASTQTSQSVGKEILSLLDSFLDIALPTAAEIDTILRKFAHFSIYAALGGSFYLALRKTVSGKWGLCAALFSLSYAATDELHQYFVPGRSAQASDILLDFSGSLFGILCLFLLYRYILKRFRH